MRASAMRPSAIQARPRSMPRSQTPRAIRAGERSSEADEVAGAVAEATLAGDDERAADGAGTVAGAVAALSAYAVTRTGCSGVHLAAFWGAGLATVAASLLWLSLIHISEPTRRTPI